MPDELRAQIEDYMSRYPDYHSAAIPALMAAQKWHGWCSDDAIKQIAAVMQVTPAYLSSVATFYDMLRTKPVGSRYVYVCTSVACHLRQADGSTRRSEEARAQDVEDVEMREFECLGACDMAPMASSTAAYVGPLSVEDAPEVVRQLKEGREVLPGRGLGDADYQLPDPRRSPRASASRRSRARRRPARDRRRGAAAAEPAPHARARPTARARTSVFEDEAASVNDVRSKSTATSRHDRGTSGSAARRVRKALLEMDAAASQQLEARAARPRRRRLRDGQEGPFIPKGQTDNFLTCNADESEPGTFKDRQLMQ